MQTIIIIFLLVFFFKVQKPHKRLVEFISRTLMYTVKLFIAVIKHTINGFERYLALFAHVWMEVECALKPEEEKQIREDLELWLKVRNKQVAKSDLEGRTRHRIQTRSWSKTTMIPEIVEYNPFLVLSASYLLVFSPFLFCLIF